MSAIPSLLALEDCAEFSKAVEPFLPQLYELPWRLVNSASSPGALLELYKATNPLVFASAFSILLAAVFLVVSEINKNYSQVDRMWSLLPTVYNTHFAIWSHLNHLPSQRLDIILLWSVIWSARLTFNYWRKGGYNIGSEDYRWEIVRDHVQPALFFIFNVTFISFIQSVLLFMLAAPTYVILLASQHEQEITTADLAFTGVQLSLIAIEWLSDQQQWGMLALEDSECEVPALTDMFVDYQTAKKQYQKTARVPRGFKQEDLDRGFITSGLWAYCRHPNFTAEQSIWFVLYQWSCYASKVFYGWAGLGIVSLIMLFQGSTWLTEVIAAGKYPGYRHYQHQVGMQIPNLKGYKFPQPKVIRTSELANKQKAKQG